MCPRHLTYPDVVFKQTQKIVKTNDGGVKASDRRSTNRGDRREPPFFIRKVGRLENLGKYSTCAKFRLSAVTFAFRVVVVASDGLSAVDFWSGRLWADTYSMIPMSPAPRRLQPRRSRHRRLFVYAVAPESCDCWGNVYQMGLSSELRRFLHVCPWPSRGRWSSTMGVVGFLNFSSAKSRCRETLSSKPRYKREHLDGRC
jgi:hypothetical protein